MKVVTAEQMREMDRRSIEDYDIPGIVLMENAGICVVNALQEKFPRLAGWEVLVVCGKGNNGGDGFVVAKHLDRLGVDVKTVLLSDADQLKGDAAANCRMALKAGLTIEQITGGGQIKRLEEMLDHCHLVVDAILGTGIAAGVEGFFRDVMRMINNSGKPVVAVDIPSGLSSDSGEIPGEHVRAQLTVTFGRPKLGQLLYPAARHVGELVVADIGIPGEVMEDEGIKVNLLNEELLSGYIAEREPDSHKGTYGHLLVVAGSTGKTGAGILAAIGALRSGAGLVTLAIPERFNTSMETALTEVMTLPLPETDQGTISAEAAPVIKKSLKDKDALVIGPGLTTHPSTRDFQLKVLEECSIPAVVDADGCNNLTDRLEVLKKCRGPLSLTPHPGEMSRMTGYPVAEIQRDRIKAARDFAAANSVHLALKGAHTLVCDPEGNIFINSTGNPSMATAGMGDVLSGIMGSFLAQGLSPCNALNLGVYLHGRCGDIAVERRGRAGILAGDLLDLIPEALEELLGNSG